MAPGVAGQVSCASAKPPAPDTMPNSSRDSADEAAYAAVLAELRSGVRDEPLMAKAYAEAEGDDNRARALYLRWRSAKLMRPAAPQHRPGFSDPTRLLRLRQWARRPRRSWSHPRPYDGLLVIAVLLGLFLLDRDFHNVVVHLLRSLKLALEQQDGFLARTWN